MNKLRLLVLLHVLVAGIFLGWSCPAVAHDSHIGTLADVHKILLQAAGYNSDTPPTVNEQKELLTKALKMIRTIPHVYHGELKSATQSINAALSELSNGDPAHKAREDIFDADDKIKSIM